MIVSVIDMWLERYTTGPSTARRFSKPSTDTSIPRRSAVVTEEKHTLAQLSVVSRPSGWLTAQYGNTLVTPSV